MSTRIPFVTVCALLLAPSVASAAGVLGPTMSGTIIPDGPLGLQGAVVVAGAATMWVEGRLVGADFAASRSDMGMLLEEWKWRDGSAEPSTKPPPTSLYGIESAFFKDARVAIKQRSPADFVELSTRTNASRAELLHATCSINRAAGPSDRAPTTQLDLPTPLIGLRAQCTAAAASVRPDGNASTQIRFVGSDLQIDGRRVGSRAQQEVIVETGSTVARADVGSHLYEHVLRRATLIPHGPRSHGPISIGQANVSFDSPTIVGFGDLSIPSHEGRLIFDGLAVEDVQGPINATGHFTLVPDHDASPQAIWVTGSITRVDMRVPATPLIALAELAPVAAVAGILALVGLALFLVSRARNERQPEHPTRTKIRALVEEKPGIRLHELVARLAMARGSVMHHLDVLRAQKKVVVITGPRSLRVFPASRQPTKATDPRLEALQVLLATRHAAKQSEIAAALGVSQSFVSKQIRRLEKSGDLSRRRASDHTVYWIRSASRSPWSEPHEPLRSGITFTGRLQEA